MDTEKKGIPGSTLKWIAIIAMFIDHLGATIVENFMNGLLPDNVDMMTQDEVVQWVVANPAYSIASLVDGVMRLIGRFGFPIFAFLLVEGFTHTRSVKKYVRNLLLFALISEIPFNLAFTGKLCSLEYQNVFCTLAIGVIVLTGIHYFEQKEWTEEHSPIFYVSSFLLGAMLLYLVFDCQLSYVFPVDLYSSLYWIVLAIGGMLGLIILPIVARKWEKSKKNAFAFGIFPVLGGVVIADLLKTDYAAWGVFTIVIMYLLRANKMKEMGCGCLALTLMSPIECTAFLMMIPVAKYNGKRGMNLKYFFYAFYPVHLLILYLITLALGFTGFAIY